MHESEEDQAPNSRQFTLSGFSIGPTQNTLGLDITSLLRCFGMLCVLGGSSQSVSHPATDALGLLVSVRGVGEVYLDFPEKGKWARMSKNKNKKTPIINKCNYYYYCCYGSGSKCTVDLLSIGVVSSTSLDVWLGVAPFVADT